MSWYITSYGWIKEQERNNPDMSREELRNHCSKNYPYAERKGWAYKAWLSAMRDVFGSKKKSKTADRFVSNHFKLTER